jgi:pyruvate dehydrogenase E1 component
MAEDALRAFRTRYHVPVSDEEIVNVPFYRPDADSPEMKYLHERRAALGGYVPRRSGATPPQAMPDSALFSEFHKSLGTPDKMPSTTFVFVNLLRSLMRDKNIGSQIVPIIPDEARTFGMDGCSGRSASTPASASCTTPPTRPRPQLRTTKSR